MLTDKNDPTASSRAHDARKINIYAYIDISVSCKGKNRFFNIYACHRLTFSSPKRLRDSNVSLSLRVTDAIFHSFSSETLCSSALGHLVVYAEFFSGLSFTLSLDFPCIFHFPQCHWTENIFSGEKEKLSLSFSHFRQGEKVKSTAKLHRAHVGARKFLFSRNDLFLPFRSALFLENLWLCWAKKQCVEPAEHFLARSFLPNRCAEHKPLYVVLAAWADVKKCCSKFVSVEKDDLNNWKSGKNAIKLNCWKWRLSIRHLWKWLLEKFPRREIFCVSCDTEVSPNICDLEKSFAFCGLIKKNLSEAPWRHRAEIVIYRLAGAWRRRRFLAMRVVVETSSICHW